MLRGRKESACILARKRPSMVSSVRNFRIVFNTRGSSRASMKPSGNVAGLWGFNQSTLNCLDWGIRKKNGNAVNAFFLIEGICIPLFRLFHPG